MSRRSIRGNRRYPNVRYSAADPIAALAPSHWYRADTYTTSGANLSTMPNRGSAGGTLAIGAGVLVEPVAKAVFNNQKAVSFTGTQYLQSNLAASAFALLHSGSGVEVHIAYAATAGAAGNDALFITRGTVTGAQAWRSADGTLNAYASNVAATVLQGASAAGALPVGAARHVIYRFDTAATPDYAVLLGATSQFSGDIVSAPTTAAPEIALRVGGSSGLFAEGDIADFLIFPRSLTAGERTTVATYMARYGL